MLFNIGDKVRIISHECGNQAGGSNPNMSVHVGEVLNIRAIERRGDRVGYRLRGNQWLWDERLLELASEESSNNKHQRVINKIKQMETRRKQLGYKTYQFVTGQEDKSDVQYKVVSSEVTSSDFRRFVEYMSTTITSQEIDF